MRLYINLLLKITGITLYAHHNPLGNNWPKPQNSTWQVLDWCTLLFGPKGSLGLCCVVVCLKAGLSLYGDKGIHEGLEDD